MIAARRKLWKRALLLLVVLILVSLAAARVLGFNPILRYGGALWLSADADKPWVPESMSVAMRNPPPDASAGAFAWREISSGFDVGEIPVIAAGSEVDRILIARVDPARFKFVVRNAPAGDKHLDDWMKELNATLVVNGSYFTPDGTPETPIVSEGKPLGPGSYNSTHGAFVSSGGSAALRDLAHEDWRIVLKDADNALVSYPLLIAPDGSTSRVPKGSGWLANRSFVGEDRAGRIIIGTTKGAFFSLDRLAEFLKQSPLDLVMALNLDGGPVACQAIHLDDFRRRYCGRWEMQVRSGKPRMLPPWRLMTSPMPIALAVFPRT
jgi:hypothetical protein